MSNVSYLSLSNVIVFLYRHLELWIFKNHFVLFVTEDGNGRVELSNGQFEVDISDGNINAKLEGYGMELIEVMLKHIH